MSNDVVVAWVGNIRSGVSWSFCFLVRIRNAVSQVVVEVESLLVAPSAGVVLESGFSTVGVVENGLIGAFSVFLFELPPAL